MTDEMDGGTIVEAIEGFTLDEATAKDHLTLDLASPIQHANTSWTPIKDRYDWCYETGMDMYMLSLTFGVVAISTVILVLIFCAQRIPL